MAIPFLNNITLDDNQLLNAKIHVTSSAPTAAKGQIYLDSSSGVNKLKYHNGTAFVIADATVSSSFNTSDGIITFTTSSGDTYTVDIDGRFIKDFVVAGDSGDNQTISNGNTLTISGGTELGSVGSATDTITINHSDVSRTNTTGSALTPDFGGNVDVITGVTSNARGHITGVETTNITIPQNDSVDVTSTNTNATYYPTFVTGTGDVAINIDSNASNKLSYNPSTQTLTVKNLTVQGDQTISNETIQIVEDNIIRFEGTTANDFETDLTVVDPTADRTITLPDESGTVVLNAFKTITADSGTDAVADSSTDTLTISGGNAISTVADATGDSITINHDDTSSQASVNNSGNTVIQDVTLDTYGHITGLVSATIVVPTDREFVRDLDATESSVTKSTNTYTVTHSLNSRDVMVEVYHTANYDTIFVDITRATVNTITVEFAAAVTDGDYRVLIKKIG
jgi:hypothetical protein